MTDFIGYSTTDKTRGPFNLMNAELAIADLKNVLLTRRGERVMLPEFGSDLPNLVFEPHDEDVMEAMREEVREAVARDPVRLRLRSLDIASTGDHSIRIDAGLDYLPTGESAQLQLDVGEA